MNLGIAQDKVQLSGSVEQFFVSAGYGELHKTRDRFTRLMGIATSGKWELRGSHWYAPVYFWYEVDETNLSYSDKDLRWRIGRFLLPVGQTNWDDQWYSGIVFWPLIESKTYGDQRLLARTVVGTDVEKSWGNHTLRVSASSSKPEVNRLLPSRLDRASVRWSYYQNGVIVGLSTYFDTKTGGNDERMVVADARWTLPQWTLRAEALDYKSDTAKVQGFFVDLYHRPKSWTDVTFVGRFEGRRSEAQSVSNMQAWTVGAKAHLPLDFTFIVNYTGGPDMNKIFLGGGWSLGLSKTLRF